MTTKETSYVCTRMGKAAIEADYGRKLKTAGWTVKKVTATEIASVQNHPIRTDEHSGIGDIVAESEQPVKRSWTVTAEVR